MLKSILNRFFGTNREVESKRDSPSIIKKENAEDSARKEGISLFHKERFEEAHKIFEKLNSEHPTSESKFFLSLTSIKRGDVEKAIELFDEAIDIFEIDTKNVPHSIPNMKTYFAKELIEVENYSLAFRLLKDTSITYFDYQILDDTFLFMRGVPFFGDYVEILGKLKDHVDKSDFDELISKLEKKLGKDAKLQIDHIIRKIDDNDKK